MNTRLAGLVIAIAVTGATPAHSAAMAMGSVTCRDFMAMDATSATAVMAFMKGAMAGPAETVVMDPSAAPQMTASAQRGCADKPDTPLMSFLKDFKG